jgi:hypothetical protein
MFTDLMERLDSEFVCTHLGEIEECLGMIVKHDAENGDILLYNHLYIEKLLKEFNLEQLNEASIPATPGGFFSMFDCPTLEEIDPDLLKKYQSLIGSLMYMSICWRPDISTIVSHLARFTSCAGQKQWKAAVRVMKYLKHTKHKGIMFKGGHSRPIEMIKPIIIVSSDASHACDADGVSIDGRTFQLIDEDKWINGDTTQPPLGNLIDYASTRQRGVVATSSTEAEYIGLYTTIKSTLHKTQKLQALGFIPSNPTNIFLDSQSSMDIAMEWKSSIRSRHMNIRFHFNRIAVIKKVVELSKVDTKLNTSDMMTKFLAIQLLSQHCSRIMGGDTPTTVLKIRIRKSRKRKHQNV